MEYHLPSQFNEYGINVASPIYQAGGVGYQPTPSSFGYMSTQMQQSPYETYISNPPQYTYEYPNVPREYPQQYNQQVEYSNPYLDMVREQEQVQQNEKPIQYETEQEEETQATDTQDYTYPQFYYQEEQQANFQNPFMNTPYYGMADQYSVNQNYYGYGYEQPQMYNSYDVNQSYGYSNPYVQQQQPTPDNYQYYTDLGRYASQQLQTPQPQMYNSYDINQSYGYSNPYVQQQYMDPSYLDMQKAAVYNQAYANGQMNLSDYCFYNNAGITGTFVGVDGTTKSIFGNNDAESWYASSIGFAQRQEERQRKMQEEYDRQLENWRIVCNVHNRLAGVKEEDTEEAKNKMLYYQKWQKFYYDRAQEEYNMDQLSNFIRSLPNSTQKDYVSPNKRFKLEHCNKVYHMMNDKYPEKYGLDEYFNQGILTNQLYDEMRENAKQDEKKLNRLFDQQQFRYQLHALNPKYDPITGTSTAPTRLTGVDDIEITLPPELAKQEYVQRRLKFMDTIFKDNRLNITPNPN